ncbi:hypothetical protein EXIGLDRAFT_698514 [Exidia glandulosa HHB12029]|uniref:Uncharacterized protein n=1 Tax=Exidia glandulosa HHB12029 TaxID=1314781 RepID=A0A165E8X3_EXIGL|nr:hypothetical protein EXIGLDRAFT_698514 [Exidia glandulosa HHB12029]
MAASGWNTWVQSLPFTQNSEYVHLHETHWGKQTVPTLSRISIHTDWKPDIPRVIDNMGFDFFTTTNHRLFVFHQYPYFVARTLAQLDRQRYKTDPHVKPVVIIGKSCFLIFFIICMLARAEPCIYYRDKTFYFFTPEGVRATSDIDLDNFADSDMPRSTKLFLDADASSQPSKRILRSRHFFVIQVSSPDEEHYRWTQSIYGVEFVMDSHSDDEMVAFAPLTSTDPSLQHTLLQVPPLDVLKSAVRTFGPSLRMLSAFDPQFETTRAQDKVEELLVGRLDYDIGKWRPPMIKKTFSCPEPDSWEYELGDSQHVVADRTV